MAKYNSIGKVYSKTRQADPRITEAIIDELRLTLPSTVADIGAGTGNYSVKLAQHGFQVLAVEPSKTMIEQGEQHQNLEWIKGFAENLPLANSSVDGVVSILATHHFDNLEEGLSEMVRVVKEDGSTVIFTADPRLCPQDCWLRHYLPFLYEAVYKVNPPLEDLKRTIKRISGTPVKVIPFLVPHDIKDRFSFAGWRKPEMYLDPLFRAGTSAFTSVPQGLVTSAIRKLKQDLRNGRWKEKFGDVLEYSQYDGGYRLLVTTKPRR